MPPVGDYSNTATYGLAPNTGTTIAFSVSSVVDCIKPSHEEGGYLFTNSHRLLLLRVRWSAMCRLYARGAEAYQALCIKPPETRNGSSTSSHTGDLRRVPPLIVSPDAHEWICHEFPLGGSIGAVVRSHRSRRDVEEVRPPSRPINHLGDQVQLIGPANHEWPMYGLWNHQ